MWMSSASSEGAMTIMLGSVAMYVTSNAPQCVAPSAPTRPPRSMAKRTACREGHCKQRIDGWSLFVNGRVAGRCMRPSDCTSQPDKILPWLHISVVKRFP
jgi:hypothetical protein